LELDKRITVRLWTSNDVRNAGEWKDAYNTGDWTGCGLGAAVEGLSSLER